MQIQAEYPLVMEGVRHISCRDTLVFWLFFIFWSGFAEVISPIRGTEIIEIAASQKAVCEGRFIENSPCSNTVIASVNLRMTLSRHGGGIESVATLMPPRGSQLFASFVK